MANIFDYIERDDFGPAKLGQPKFDYLNLSARVEAHRVRALIIDWISHYPEQHQFGVTQRLRSQNDVVHDSAFFELFLHEFLIRTGHTIVDVEPTAPKSQRRPDFLARSPNGYDFYIEAVTSINTTPQEAAAETRLNEAIRAIDAISSPFYFLDIDIEGKPARPVSIRKLQTAVSKWICELPTKDTAGQHSELIYEEHGMKLTVSAIRCKSNSSTPRGAIGSISDEVKWSTPGGGIRESVEKKSSRYGDLGIPYIVAVNAMADFRNEEDATDAMFGSPCLQIKTFDDGRMERSEVRNGDGVWWGNRGARKRGLSAILSTERLCSWSLCQRRARLIRNPWAESPLPPVSFGIDEINPDNGSLKKIEGRAFFEIFDLPSGWPED